MEQKEVSIHDFKKGDLITRIKPSKPVPGSEEFGADIRDRNYIGKALTFLGIANGCIYVEKQKSQTQIEDLDDSPLGSLFDLLMDKGGPINLPLDMWGEGWSYYVDPYNIETQSEKSKKIFSKVLTDANKIKLKEDLKKALDNENYELAEEIKRKLRTYE